MARQFRPLYFDPDRVTHSHMDDGRSHADRTAIRFPDFRLLEGYAARADAALDWRAIGRV